MSSKYASAAAVLCGFVLLAPALALADEKLAPVLRKTLDAIRDDHPNLSQMEPLTADAVRQQNGIVQPELQVLGNIVSINYLGMQSRGQDSGEAYRVMFEHGTMW